MTLRASISQLTFSDGTAVQFESNDIILLVGPNNSGKSAALRGIRDKLQNPNTTTFAVSSLDLIKSGDPSEIRDWLKGWTTPRKGSDPVNPAFQALGQTLHVQQAEHEWRRTDNGLGALARWFCHLLSADERLQICNPAPNIALSRDNPSHPVHFLLRDDKLEIKLSINFRKAFGVDLIVHRNAGNEVPLHVGGRPTPSPGEDRVSLSYIERLESLPLLHLQGDGMRSFAGVLLATSVGRESILLIDEPEAFLHPPQAYFLGKMLVQHRQSERQLFIATHSSDVLRGVLATADPNVSVIRIRRDGDVNPVRRLDNQRIKELWKDPLLRSSNILDGLFHESVIVCESDSDCRFYSAVMDATTSVDASDDTRQPDVMFTHCGGKQRLPVVIAALREVDVPVKAVADFDILSDEQPLRRVAEALGIGWSSIEADWKAVKNAIESKKPDLTTAEVKKELEKILSNITAQSFPHEGWAQIKALLKQSTTWTHAKEGGTTFVPSGDPFNACTRLLATLEAGGLYVVDVGELEGFARSEGSHGPKWVNSVLSRNLATDPELEQARTFVRKLVPK